MKDIPFKVSSATGNTFAILDAMDSSEWQALKNLPKEKLSSFLQQLCQTAHPSVDGVFFLSFSESDSKMYVWDFYNRDGSPAEMCGNAARCAFDFIFKNKETKNSTALLATEAGQVLGRKLSGEEIQVQWQIPTASLEKRQLMALGKTWEGYFINTGVPHFLVQENLSLEQARALRFHPSFGIQGTNVTYVQMENTSEIQAWTYERGVENKTLSCGTGAVAAAIFAKEKNHSQESVFHIQMPGGSLRVDLLPGKNREICLTSSVHQYADNLFSRSLYEEIISHEGCDNRPGHSLQKSKN